MIFKYQKISNWKNTYFLFSILFIMIACKNDDSLLIVVPNNYYGTFYIIEDKENYQNPDTKALENFNDYIYELNGAEIRVKNIKVFKNKKIIFSYVWAEPINDDRIKVEWENDKKIKIIIGDANIL